jgi:nicotinamide-nucleotide amidase
VTSIPGVATPASSLHALLRSRGATIATAESLTGGRLAALLTAVPGSSETYVGGVVSYATSLKTDLLGVSPELIARHGVVSAECARAMATGARQVTGATYAVSTTGVAGPGSQDGVPAGTVYVAVAGPDSVTALALELVGDRATIQDRTCEEALSVVSAILGGEETGLG